MISSKTNWFEGEEFSGILKMKIGEQGLPKCSVDIVIEGFEYVYWLQRTGASAYDDVAEHKEGKKVVDYRFKVFECDEYKKAGNYEFPVKFMIPKGIPGTFIHHSSVSASLTYVMYCEFMQESTKIASVWHPLMIMQNDRPPSSLQVEGDRVVSVSSGGCFKKNLGPMHLNVNFDKNRCTSNDKLSVYIMMDLREVSPKG